MLHNLLPCFFKNFPSCMYFLIINVRIFVCYRITDAGSNKLTLNMDSTDTQSPISPCRDGTILNIILEIRDNTDIIRT